MIDIEPDFAKTKVASVVVLFNPSEGAVESILSYSHQVGDIFVIDNSENVNIIVVNKIRSIQNVVYVGLDKNMGVAHALNHGARMAIEGKYEFLLTMDQDTSLPPEYVKEMINRMRQQTELVGIASAKHFQKKASKSLQLNRVLFTMTSANLVNLRAYQCIGPFRDDLFIDYVDCEFCLRLNKMGFRVLEFNKTSIVHNLGELIEKKILFYHFKFRSHSPFRLYYIFRNGLLVSATYSKDFPKIRLVIFSVLFKELLKALLLEDKKFVRLKFILDGCVDYLNRRLGKYADS